VVFFGVQQASWEHGGHGTTFAINQLPNKQGYQSNLWIAAEMFVLDMPKVLRQCDILRRVSGLVGSFVLASSLSLSFVFLFACHTHVDMFLPLFCTLAFFFTKQTAYQIYWAGFVQIEKNGRYKEKSDKFLVFDSQKHKIRNIYFFFKKEQK